MKILYTCGNQVISKDGKGYIVHRRDGSGVKRYATLEAAIWGAVEAAGERR